MKIAQNVTELIGKTPLLRLTRWEEKHGLKAAVIAKLEYFNPTGSTKDRAAFSMIEDAERRGVLKPGATIIEPTSGNTGIGLAAIAAAKGYRAIFVMPETMSVERRALIAAYGAEIVLTPGAKGMKGTIEKTEELKKEIPNVFVPSQFDNPANPAIHERTTGPEIWADTDGKIDIFVATFGTGGTVSGAGRYLKSKNPAIEIVAVEPAASPLITEGHAGPHGIQGIGANFVPDNLDRSVVDTFLTATNEEAFAATKEIARTEGVLVGISSGAALAVATRLAKDPKNAGKRIVALMPDTGARYLSTPIFAIK